MKNLILILFLMQACPVFAQDPNLTLSSPAFENKSSIPSKYTCQGENVNPPLAIKNVPLYTKSLVLMIHDPDAPAGDWVHWAVYNIPPQTTMIREKSIPGREVINDFNQYNYGGPCPPQGETHQYIFDLYALDTNFDLNENGSPRGLLQIIHGHILSKAQLTGIYKN